MTTFRCNALAMVQAMMVISRRAVITAAFISAPLYGVAQAQQPGQQRQMRYQIDAGELAALCREDQTDQRQVLNNLICAGYISGVQDGAEVGAARAPGGQNFFCVPPGTARSVAGETFQRYFEAHADRQSLPAAMVVALALKERFPCPAQ